MQESSYYAHTQQVTRLQNQRKLQQEQQKQQGLHQHQHHHHHHHQQQQHHQHHHQQQQQKQQQNVASTSQSFTGGGGRCKQQQQIKKTSPIRTETKIIDELQPSYVGGDINANIADVPPSPDVERELEESHQEYSSFDGDEDGLSRNGSNAQHINKNVMVINVDDENDLDFSDIKRAVPDIINSGNIAPTTRRIGSPNAEEGFDVNTDADYVGNDDKIIDDVVNNRNHLPCATTPSTSNRNTNMNVNHNQKLSNNHPSSNSPTATKTKTAKIKEIKFRAYQSESWTDKFEELLQFRDKNGHCLVPNCHPENPTLAQWVKRQRYQYKLKVDGKRSTVTDERVSLLDKAGFTWDSHKAIWAERIEELKEFKKKFGHCNIPSRYQTNHQLAIWVKRQRRQWKNKMDSQPNCMTDERQQQLEALGFVWDMQKKRTKTNQSKGIKKKTGTISKEIK